MRSIHATSDILEPPSPFDRAAVLARITSAQPCATVFIDQDHLSAAKAAGANFIVSPVCEPTLVKTMVDSGLLTMAGAFTPTEVLQAYNLGTDVVKIFPGSLGGPAYVKALKGPFPYIPMMPTGGVSAANVAEWFATGVVAVGAGSELCPPQLAKEGKFDEITRRAAEFVQVVRSARG